LVNRTLCIDSGNNLVTSEFNVRRLIYKSADDKIATICYCIRKNNVGASNSLLSAPTEIAITGNVPNKSFKRTGYCGSF